MLSDLQAAGVPSSAIDRADHGCSSAFASPSSIEQGVVKFKGDGVTTATIDNDLQDVQNITRTSQSQGFHPQWTIPDEGTVATTGNPSFSPDPNNFNNALAITPFQYGANNMPGLKESPTDVQCDQIMTSHGQPAVMASGGVQFAGAVCDLMWMFVAAVDHAPGVAPDQLVLGLINGTLTGASADRPKNLIVGLYSGAGNRKRAVVASAVPGAMGLSKEKNHARPQGIRRGLPTFRDADQPPPCGTDVCARPVDGAGRALVRCRPPSSRADLAAR